VKYVTFINGSRAYNDSVTSRWRAATQRFEKKQNLRVAIRQQTARCSDPLNIVCFFSYPYLLINAFITAKARKLSKGFIYLFQNKSRTRRLTNESTYKGIRNVQNTCSSHATQSYL